MLKKYSQFLVAGLLFGTAPYLAANELEEAIKFHVSFNGSCHAEIAEGNEKGDPTGKPVFQTGIAGQAVLCGKKGVASRFIRQDNIDFDSPGTVNIWFKLDVPCGSPGPAIPFWGIGADDKKGMLSVMVMNDPMKHCPCRRQIGYLLISKKRQKYAKAYTVGSGSRRICSGWHLLSTGWAGNKLYVSLDGTPYRSFELEKPISNAEFSYARRFGTGVNYTKWNYLIDEFTIYGKRLSDTEIKTLYDKGSKQQKTVR